MASIVIKGATILTLSRREDIPSLVEQGDIRIDDDRITAIGEVPASGVDEVIDASGMVVMPGLINGHNHFEQSFMMPIVRLFPGSTAQWISDFKIPLTQQMGPEDYYLSAMLSCINMIRSGVTCSVNHVCQQSAEKLTDFGIRQVASAIGESGVRCVMPIGLAGKREAPEFIVGATEYRNSLMGWFRQWDQAFEGRLRIWPGPTGFYSSTDEMWEVSRAFADEHGCGIHTHLATFESGDVDRAEETGVLGSRLMAAHSVWLTPEDVRKMGSAGVNVVHNPTYKLSYSLDSHVTQFGDGISPVADMCDAGCRVGLGQDGCMGDTQDMFKEMRNLAFTQHYRYRDKHLFPPSKLLEMVTINNAESLRADADIGSLEPGKKADLIVLDTSSTKFVPRLHIPAAIAYQASPEDVRTVIIDGRVVMRDRKIETVDEKALAEAANAAAGSLLQKAGLARLRQESINPWISGTRLTRTLD